MMNKKWIGWKILGGVIFIPGAVLLVTWLFMLLWNALMTKVFGLPEISFWQGLGLIVLAKFLFGNICGKKKCRCKCKCKGEKHSHECHDGDKEDKLPEQPS